MEVTKKELELLKPFFDEKGYEKFRKTVDNQEQIIGTININPIMNYSSHMAGEERIGLLIRLYQNLKYYLGECHVYSPKMQEGIALVASKVAILNAYDSASRVEEYFRNGDRNLQSEKCNPFEEIARLLLNVVKPVREYSNINNHSFHMIEFERIACLDAITKSLNGEQLKKELECYSLTSVIDNISICLENSNIHSNYPGFTYLPENKDILLEQLTQIKDAYAQRIHMKIMVGEYQNEVFTNRLLKQFENKIFYAKRNIGVYEATKIMIKDKKKK